MSFELDRPIALSPHAALKTRSEGDILVVPERAIRLGGSGGEILRLCDGLRTGRDILAAMRTRYPEDRQLEAQVTAFLDEMWTLGGLRAAPGLRPELRR